MLTDFVFSRDLRLALAGLHFAHHLQFEIAVELPAFDSHLSLLLLKSSMLNFLSQSFSAVHTLDFVLRLLINQVESKTQDQSPKTKVQSTKHKVQSTFMLNSKLGTRKRKFR